MALSLVTVTVAASVSPVDTTQAEGNCIFVPSGVMWPAPGNVPIAPRIQEATLTLGTASVQLVASDNFAAGVLTWNVIINIRGVPTINVPDVPVNFASGATQNLFDILTAYGWAPTGT